MYNRLEAQFLQNEKLLDVYVQEMRKAFYAGEDVTGFILRVNEIVNAQNALIAVMNRCGE